MCKKYFVFLASIINKKKPDSKILVSENPLVEELVAFLRNDCNYYYLVDAYIDEYSAAKFGDVDSVILFIDEIISRIIIDGKRFRNNNPNHSIISTCISLLMDNPKTKVSRLQKIPVDLDNN
jgi:hypothetical protein